MKSVRFKRLADQILELAGQPLFWILILFVYGLFGIDLPPIDRHEWRQALTLMISRNFYLFDYSIFYPHYDIGGETDGILPTEFPFYNYLSAYSYDLFGYNHWSARLINWITTCAGIFYFYKISIKVMDKKAALVSMLLMCSSVIIVYGLKTMPDTFALSLVIIGVYYYWNYIKLNRHLHLLVGAAFITVGVLCKIPMMSMVALLVIPIMSTRLRLGQWLLVGLSILLGGSCVAWWYFHWMPYLEVNFGNKLIWPVGLIEGAGILIDNLGKVLSRIAVSTFHNPLVFVLFLLGFFFGFKKKKYPLILASIFYLVSVILFICKTGHTYYLHDYYSISIVPLMCLLAGFTWSCLKLKRAWATLLVVLLAVPAFVNQHNIIQERGYPHYLKIEKIIASLPMDEGDKLLVSGDSAFNPTLMYFTGKRGWSRPKDQIENEAFIQSSLIHKLKYIVVDKNHDIRDLPYKVVFSDDDFIIYQPKEG